VQKRTAVSSATHSVCSGGRHHHTEPQVLKIKLPDASHLSMLIYSRGNNKEYLTHIVVVLQVIEQKGLPKKCQVLAKAVVRRSEVLKNL
jgi:hypothetical protein